MRVNYLGSLQRRPGAKHVRSFRYGDKLKHFGAGHFLVCNPEFVPFTFNVVTGEVIKLEEVSRDTQETK